MLSSRASSVASLPPIRRPNHASRFEGIPKTKLQASSASDPETLQSQVTKTARKRLSLRGLEVLHGRLVGPARAPALGDGTSHHRVLLGFPISHDGDLHRIRWHRGSC